MSTNDDHPGGLDRKEPIPGYKVIDLLGRGGYGEVWRAIAPGGIAKAVKIVYGDGDPTRVAAEMRALARIKDVRHPLLLSIERIEVTDGALVMVTELADGSLKDHFLGLRDAGAVGVPQDELLQYTADAGEALDFLYDKYSLQHLDVKPENILIVSGRAKVGDFGLVKSLYERSASMIGGLTPTYAPPELFEGKPTRHSDQYSLAIVYMHMLTGVLPYSGSSMAQIATQHLRGVPDLAALPKRQRTVVARALSKDPNQRFASCSEMVRALRESARESEPLPSRTLHAENSLDYGSGDNRCNAPGQNSSINVPAAKSLSGSLADTKRPPKTETAFGANRSSQMAGGGRPTVLVGVGGAGVEVLAKVVARLRDRFGSIENWPSVEMLALDTNTKFVSSQFQEAELPRVGVVPIPLKTAEEYGPRAGEFLRWLGRRWFYNIPRDTASAGYRPFGRLALLTHARTVREAIKGVITRAAGSAAGDSAQPRVVLVGSISGGTGGGALLDLAYALRSELKSRGLPDEQVHGLLLHATARSNADRDRARANAYATLTELNHYSRAGGNYPGEPLLGAPPFHGDNATFSQTNVLHLGEGLGQGEWDLAIEQVAELVYCANFTAARSILDEQATESCSGQPCHVQSLGVLSLGAGNCREISQSCSLAINDVIRTWREGRSKGTVTSVRHSSPTAILHACSLHSAGSSPEIDGAVAEQLAKCKLDGEELLKDASAVLELEVGASAGHFADNIVDEALSTTSRTADQPGRITSAIELIDRLLLAESEDTLDQEQGNPLFPQIVSRLCIRTHSRVEGLLNWIKELVDAHAMRVDGARQHAVGTRQTLQTICEKLYGQAAGLHEQALAVALEARSPDANKSEKSRFAGWTFRKPSADDKLRTVLKPYAETRLKEFLLRVAAKRIRLIDAEVSEIVDHILRLARDLSLLVEPARERGADADEESLRGSAAMLSDYRQKLHQLLRLRRQNVVEKIDTAIGRDVFGPGGGLRNLLEPESEVRRMLWQPLNITARQAVLESIREISCQMIGGTGSAQGQERVDLAALISSSFPAQSAVDQSDIATQILVIPDAVDPTHLRERLGPALANLNVVQGHKCDVTLCSLRHPEPLSQVANDLIGGIDIYRELAGRLHTRADIGWSTFADDESASPADGYSDPGTEFHSHTAALPIPV